MDFLCDVRIMQSSYLPSDHQLSRRLKLHFSSSPTEYSVAVFKTSTWHRVFGFAMIMRVELNSCQVYDAVHATQVPKLFRSELRPVIRNRCLWRTPCGEENVESHSGGLHSRIR